MMLVKDFRRLTSWADVLDAAKTTKGNEPTGVTPSSVWKKKILLSEHSPIRFLEFTWTWEDLPYWVSVHFVRHKYGIEHFVRSQRPARENGAELSQNEFVIHKVKANAQTIINVSKERLCSCASSATNAAWSVMLIELAKIEPELRGCCVPKCCYRGYCPEGKHACGVGEPYWDRYKNFVNSANLKRF